MSKNDDAWEMFFDHTNTLSEINKAQYAFVKADALKKYGQREPRLMTKIDTLEVRPEIFKDNHLSILPVRNGKYLIFKDHDQRSYYCFDNFLENIPISLHKPVCNLDDFDSYPGEERMNEAQAIDFAFLSSIIKTFTKETKMWLTIRGRQFTGSFSFIIPSIKKDIEIKSVQIEIDAGYESPKKIYLFEAKIGRRSNFNIRQLYYPYLEWKQRSGKEIIPILFFNTNGLNYFFQFRFGETFNDIQLSKYACFSLDETLVTHANLKSMLANSVYKEKEPIEYPFPQADDMDKVIDTISLISQGYDDKAQISEELEFDERQGDYYGNAGCYLGFLEHEDGKYKLSNLGKQFVALNSRSKRANMVLLQLVKTPVFRSLIEKIIDNDFDIQTVSEQAIYQLIKKFTDLSEATTIRRSSTVKQWLRWVKLNTEIDV